MPYDPMYMRHLGESNTQGQWHSGPRGWGGRHGAQRQLHNTDPPKTHEAVHQNGGFYAMWVSSQFKGKERKSCNVPTAACTWKWGRILAGPEAGRKQPALGGAGQNWTVLFLLSTQEPGWVRDSCSDRVRVAASSYTQDVIYFLAQEKGQTSTRKKTPPFTETQHTLGCCCFIFLRV